MCKGLPRCYFPKNFQVTSIQVHGFSDALEMTYAGVVYLRMVDTMGSVHISLKLSKTKVYPIKRLSIPRLELCGTQILAKLLYHLQKILIFNVPVSDIYAWTDSEIVLHWLSENP